MRELFSRLIGFALGRRHDPQLDDEVEFHLAMLADDYVRRGMTPEEARTAARRTFGGVMQAKEAYRDRRGLPGIAAFVQDARYALRTLCKTPGFTITALLTLALGIGANTAIFSVVHAVVLRPLPFADPDRLVVFGDSSADGLPGNIGYTTLHDYRERARTLANVVAVRTWSPTLVANGEAERINAMRVSWDYFEMLGVRPALGRGFTRDEDRQDHWRVLMISDGLAQRRFVTRLLGTFALLALLLATIGLYGVVSYMVAQRTREVGLRVALGASAGHILRLILGSGIKTVAIGLAVGLAATLVVARFLGTLLFGVDPHDPVTLGAAAGILMLVALLAHLIPAMRALRIDPSIALRQE
jgi:hypothetical protein